MKSLVVFLVSIAFPVLVAAQAPAPPPDPKAAPATLPSSKNPKINLGSSAATGAKAGAATKTAPGATATGTAATKAAGAKGAADKAGKKEEPPPKIEGMEIARGAKGFLGLQVVDGNFKLSFFDPKKKAVAPDVRRAVLRWTPNYKPGTEIYVLEAGGGKFLSVAKTVRPPYSFKLFMSLFVEGNDEPVESYVLDFRQ
jgi:hypothetical protein